MLNLPNFLTLLRILTIPVFLEFLSYRFFWEALLVFAIGGFTDFLDGFVARWMNQQTPLGTYLDPVADKLLVITSFVVLGYAIIYFLVEERFEVKPTVVGKWSTTLQLLTLAVALVTLDQPKLLPSLTLDVFVDVTAVLSVVSGCQYLYRGLVWLQTKAPSITRLGWHTIGKLVIKSIVCI